MSTSCIHLDGARDKAKATSYERPNNAAAEVVDWSWHDNSARTELKVFNFDALGLDS
jgi:hypothetical protein